ncbi:hypothetical protein LAZ67_12002186 [Cordylochernes scorpioides]|uniref:GIY-YIG domain-containing protein n=1 Tax=Cordylochernes scorpioides TaxID=51811 RepID=A0ABY6L6G7_9ARAC|nr:hypothetical protein LAZ67_12002186 [Cordylochernes scorpioides]
MEKWKGKKPSVSHIMRFGCEVFYKLENHQRHKLEAKSKRGIFVGYSRCRRDYRVFDITARVILETADIHFRENNNVISEEKQSDNNMDTDTYFFIQEDEELDNHVLSDVDIEEPAPDTMINRQTESSGSDRPQRTRTIPKRFDDYVLATTNETIPKDYEEAIACEDKKHWENAMLEEIQNMYSHQVWELVPRPVNAKVVKSKWVFKISKDQENKTYKARLVAMGYNQIPGRDYNESFSPVIKNATLRTIFIYGLPQSGRSWYEKFSQVLHDCGLEKLKSDPCLFKWKNEDKYFYVGIYVDDFITVSDSKDTSNRFINKLRHHLEIKDVTCKGMFLGIKIIQDKEGISLQQSHNVQQILQKYGMENCKEVPTPDDNCDQHTYQEALGMLMFLAVNTRPDIAYITSKLSQYSRQPKQMHWTAIKRVMRYLRGTIELGLKFERGKTGILKSYTDASWSTTHDGKSYGGYVLKLGEATIDWKSSKQPLVALSTMEAEMIAACESCCQIKWIINLLQELEEWNFMEKPTAIYTDSQSLINWISSPKQSSHCRHIERKYHFLRDCYESRDICLLYKPSQDLEADIFTKDLSRDQMKKHMENLSIVGIKTKSMKSKALDKRKLKLEDVAAPLFKGLPKIHKEGVPLRPIVSGFKAPTRGLADWLKNQIPTTRKISGLEIRNRKELLDITKNLKLNEHEIMVSFDVKSLFTNINRSLALKELKEYFEVKRQDCTIKGLEIDEMIEGFRLCLENIYFRYGAKFYRQKDGTAMGCPTSMIIADIVMASIDRKSILIEGIKIWGRYIDDVFAVIQKEKLNEIIVKLNNLEIGIEFTVETEKEGFLPFLDVGLSRKEDGSILTSVYRKPTDCGIHLNFNSNNPILHKRQVIKSLVQRAKQVCTDQDIYKKEIKKIRAELKQSEYPVGFINKWIRRYEIDRPNLNRTTEGYNNIIIPYIREVDNEISRILKKCKYNIWYSTGTKREFLTRNNIMKDNIGTSKPNNVIYGIKCTECDKIYVGETVRNLETRIKEHQQGLLGRRALSKIGEHALFSGHRPDWNDIEIFHRNIKYKKEILFLEGWVSREFGKRTINTFEDIPQQYASFLNLKSS